MEIRHTIRSPRDQAASLRRLAAAEDRRRGFTIAITSGQGGAGISQSVLAFARMADVVTVVSISEPTSLTDAYAIIKLLVRRRYHGPIRLLVNMARGRVEARRTFARVAEVAEKLLDFRLADRGYVLQDNHVELAVRGRTPMVLSYPRCLSSLFMTAFAARLLQAGAARVAARNGWLVAKFVGLLA